jgi:hypothetical protein
MVALLPVPGPPRQRGRMQIAEAIAEQMGCEHEQRGNTALGERLGEAWGRVSICPVNVAGFQEDGAAD